MMNISLCVHLQRNDYSDVLLIFKLGYLSFITIVGVLYIFWIQVPHQKYIICHKLYFSPSIFLYVLNNIFEDGNFPGSSDSKESTRNVGDPDSVPGSGRSSGERNGNPLQCSCLKNSMDRGVWQPTVMGCKESDMTEQLTLSLSNTFEDEWSVKLYIAPCSH